LVLVDSFSFWGEQLKPRIDADEHRFQPLGQNGSLTCRVKATAVALSVSIGVYFWFPCFNCWFQVRGFAF
jgi:hypothetical protein